MPGARLTQRGGGCGGAQGVPGGGRGGPDRGPGPRAVEGAASRLLTCTATCTATLSKIRMEAAVEGDARRGTGSNASGGRNGRMRGCAAEERGMRFT